MSDLAVPLPGVLAEFSDRDLDRFERWIAALSRGVGPMAAGAEVNWSPAKVKRLISDPDIANIMQDIEDAKDEHAEYRLFQSVDAGNMTAIQMWLYNRRPDRWRDIKKIVTETHVTADHTVVINIREAVGSLLRDNGVAALQPGGALDEIIDAEVVSDSNADA